MKGPGMRIELDVSRTWRCPKCGRTVGTRGTVTARRCRCTEAGEWMLLDEPIRQPRSFASVIEGIQQQRKPDKQHKPAGEETEAETETASSPGAKDASESDSTRADSPRDQSVGESAATETSTSDSSTSDAAAAEPADETAATNVPPADAAAGEQTEDAKSSSPEGPADSRQQAE